MKFSVACARAADEELAAIWLAATDRAAISNAAREIEFLLQTTPLECGESRDGNVRILFIPPLGVRYAVFVDDRRVEIGQFWSY